MAKEINLREIYLIVKKRIWIIVIVTFIATIFGYFQNNSNTTLQYQTSGRIIVGANSDYMQTLMVIMRDPIIMEKVAAELNLNRSPEALANQINVDSINSSQVVRITVTDTNPELAADIANVTATVFKNEIESIVDFNDVSFLSDAKVNNYPINTPTNRTIYIAFIMGLVISGGFVFLLHSLDDTVTSQRELEEVVGIPVLGTVSKMNKKNLNKKKQKHPEIEYRGELIGLEKTKNIIN